MISIVCPIFNEEKYIDGLLRSIINQDYPQDDIEVLLVDGMSSDRTREIAAGYTGQFKNLRIIDNPHRVAPFAMNIGIRESKGDIIIRLDAHAFFPTNYISELVKNKKELKADNVGGVCRTLPAKDTVVCRSIANVLSSSFGMGNSHFRVGAKAVMEVDTVPFGCFHRELFDRIGLFDEELIRNQDDEFNGRILKNGGKIYLLPQLVIDYYARDTISKVYNMFYQYGLFKPLVNKKLGSPATLRQFFPPAFVLGLVFGPLLAFVSRWFLVAYIAVLFIYLGIAIGFSVQNSKNLKEVLIQVKTYFVVHFAYGWGYINGLWKLLTHQSFTAKSNR